MTATRRIILNVTATYGRSLYSLALGIFTTRWVLQALGKVDFGLMSLVGGLTGFITFFNGILASSVGRFYAVEIGRANASKDKMAALEECRKWFSMAIFIHTVVPLALMLAGYPLGVWVVENFLVIPADRVGDCVWVFRFVCVTCLLGMMSVPFRSMYTAKQYIAELTVYSFVTATVNVVFVYYMASHPGEWLARYAGWSCMLALFPQLIIAARALSLFPECRFRLEYCRDFSRLWQIFSYAGWTVVGAVASLLRAQGVAILVNRYFGPGMNAAMGVAGSVNSKAMALSASIRGAMTPVISAAVGAGDMASVKKLAFRFCKVSLSLSLVFLVPLALELPYVMRLWLKKPPEYAVGLCWIMLAISFVDKNTLGHGMAVMSFGVLKWYQIVLGGFNLLTLPLAWCFCALGYSVYWVGFTMFATWCMLSYGRLYFARRLLGMSVFAWLREIMMPILVSLVVSVAAGLIPVMLIRESILRLVVTTVFSVCTFAPMVWFVVFSDEERVFVSVKMRKVFANG